MSGFRAPVDLKRLHVYRQGTSAGSVYVAGNFSKELAADPAVDPCTEYVGAYVPEKTCATCKHWDEYEDEPKQGDCKRIKDDEDTKARLYVTEWGNLCCASTFGCVLHEEKEG